MRAGVSRCPVCDERQVNSSWHRRFRRLASTKCTGPGMPGLATRPRLRPQPAQAWGRCRSSACTVPSAVRCATRNSPVTNVVGAISSASRMCGSTGRCTQTAVGSPLSSVAARILRVRRRHRWIVPAFLFAQQAVGLDRHLTSMRVGQQCRRAACRGGADEFGHSVRRQHRDSASWPGVDRGN